MPSKRTTSGIKWGLVAALSMLMVVALSACSLPGAAAARPSPSPDPQAQMLKFAECMRANGVPDFPDPSTTAGGGMDVHFSAGDGIDPKSSTFQKAEQACSKYIGGSLGTRGKPDKAMQARMLKFAQCMRSHGVTSFPDPSSDGGISIQAGSDPGLDPNDPTFKAAQLACAALEPKGGGASLSTGSGK